MQGRTSGKPELGGGVGHEPLIAGVALLSTALGEGAHQRSPADAICLWCHAEEPDMLISLLPAFPSPACCRIIHRSLDSRSYPRTRPVDPKEGSRKVPERESWRPGCNSGMAADRLCELGRVPVPLWALELSSC